MAKFIYKARNWEGKIVTAEVEGDSKESVVQKLRERGFFVTSIKEKAKEMVLFQKKVAPKEVSIFARQFATMIGSGVPLVRCLNILQEQMDNPRFCDIIRKLRQDVEAGATFSAALEKHPSIFSNLFVNLVKAGEAGGILDEILERLANYLESSEELKAKVKGALTYPAVVICIAMGVVVFLLTFVLPSFQSIFEGMGNVELPLPTKILLDTSNFMREYFVFLAIAFGMAVVGIKKFFATKQGVRILDTNILKMPALGMMLKKVAVARFTRTLGTLIASGVPILQALEVTAETAGNVVIADAVHKTRISIKEGESIAEPLKQSKVFPPMVVQMIAVGEETGELDAMLTKIADFYDSEVDTSVKALTSVIEPIIIVFMGLVIGGIVMAIFMPMLKLVNMNQ
ncbi:MAG: pilus assembly protein PilC [Candidatus Wallbacteria bacterium HGW-Wallbacteria-1]|jgi:type IV pilus assembly protein PilC|uniref:Pilus assembly protein PilC n=1 Tax=Candidatus Wallbacteria bacterium HGW-Wallbacteria-1 TaxID=2013854 RepID=A0A2N1PU10_9BACT|nr:MAG: pilus assembly protein PilC [Candidatus Wallbacteria bacterium HGW-Wallbacteria-1]